jgi:uncharacterized membrane protein
MITHRTLKIHRTIILFVVVYRCETLSLTLREGRRIRVLEKRVFSRIFGPKMDEIRGEWRKYIMRSLIICKSKVTPLQARCGPEGG